MRDALFPYHSFILLLFWTLLSSLAQNGLVLWRSTFKSLIYKVNLKGGLNLVKKPCLKSTIFWDKYCTIPSHSS